MVLPADFELRIQGKYKDDMLSKKALDVCYRDLSSDKITGHKFEIKSGQAYLSTRFISVALLKQGSSTELEHLLSQYRNAEITEVLPITYEDKPAIEIRGASQPWYPVDLPREFTKLKSIGNLSEEYVFIIAFNPMTGQNRAEERNSWVDALKAEITADRNAVIKVWKESLDKGTISKEAYEEKVKELKDPKTKITMAAARRIQAAVDRGTATTSDEQFKSRAMSAAAKNENLK